MAWNLNPLGHFYFYKLEEIYDQLLKAHKIPKKNGCFSSPLHATISTREGKQAKWLGLDLTILELMVTEYWKHSWGEH